jgi:RNA polymerase sigma-70 factor (ECF subfamily)
METDWEVWDTVASLSARQRAVVFLTYWADLDGRGVAEMLGISEGSVRRHLHLARETLRRRLDG